MRLEDGSGPAMLLRLAKLSLAQASPQTQWAPNILCGRPETHGVGAQASSQHCIDPGRYRLIPPAPASNVPPLMQLFPHVLDQI